MYLSHLTQSHSVLVVPRSCSTQILETFHDNIEAGHPEEIETYQSIHWWLFWVSMSRDIANYVRTCSICVCLKPSNEKAGTSMQALLADSHTSLGKSSHLTWWTHTLDGNPRINGNPRNQGPIQPLGRGFPDSRSHEWTDPENIKNWSLQLLRLSIMSVVWLWLSIHFSIKGSKH